MSAGGAALVVRNCRSSDAAQVADIYNHYVRGTVVTFEEVPVDSAEMAARIEDVTERWPWLVADVNGALVGYAYAAAWKSRSAYRFSVESTVYLAPGLEQRGYGTALYRALIAELRVRGAHNVIGGIALPNPGSVALHEKLGFQKIGQFHEVGFKLGHWVDVGYWELVLK